VGGARRGDRFEWAPPLLVGIACAVAAEVAVLMLLYTGPGFTRSLTTLLATEAGALALGLAVRGPDPEPPDGLRRRWLFSLFAFLAATVYGTVWTVRPELGAARLHQGIGLAVLAGLPLFACGALVGGLAGERRRAAGAERNGAAGRALPESRGVATAAFIGAALGFGVTGFFLLRVPMPASLLVASMIALSAGGMLYASGRSGSPRVRVLSRGCAGPLAVRVEARGRVGRSSASWVLLEGDIVRAERVVELDGAEPGGDVEAGSAGADEGRPERAARSSGRDRGQVRSWDAALCLALLPPDERAWRMLHLGGGASSAPRLAADLCAGAIVTVLERSVCLAELGRTYFGAADPHGARDRIRVVPGNPEDALEEHPPASFDLILVDVRALDSVGGVGALSRRAERLLGELVAPGGCIAWGPDGDRYALELAEEEFERVGALPAAVGADVVVLRRRTDPEHA